ncbi:MAG: hybrid sensor histidine kinase/response regulator [Taibaiella sp.]|nr:hybrid sensor histidine kinase/response regulator [Taibaiella sp.]
MEKIKILYIDDEQNNLNGFKATFRFDYSILTAATTQQAHNFLNEHPDIRIILCDQRMPDKTGVQFFEEMRIKFPEPIRMLITGYTDIESVIEGINRGHIYRYIKKPWTDTDIKSAIEEGNKFFLTTSQLASKNVELQSAYDELGKFAYSVTHDLRGPLLSVLGALDIAKTIDDLNEVKEIQSMMGVALHKLDDYITSLHEYYNLKRGKLVFEEIQFSEVVNDIAALFRIAGSMENIKFNVRVSQPGLFMTDKVSVKIILNNLFSNAFKYQRKAEPNKFVDVSIGTEHNIVTIIVKDNGIGIQQEHIEDIFTMFFRATSQDIGSGFGLYNVKDALNKLNGTIEVQSVIDEGTTFKVTIPGRTNASKQETALYSN